MLALHSGIFWAAATTAKCYYYCVYRWVWVGLWSQARRWPCEG